MYIHRSIFLNVGLSVTVVALNFVCRPVDKGFGPFVYREVVFLAFPNNSLIWAVWCVQWHFAIGGELPYSLVSNCQLKL